MSSIVTRARTAYALLAASVLAVGALAGCGEGAAQRELTSDALAQAARSTSDAGSGRFTFAMDMTAPDGYETVSFTGHGAFDAALERSEMTFDLSSLASYLAAVGASAPDGVDFTNPELWKVDAVLDGVVMYMRFPLLSRLPDTPFEGKQWVKVDLRGVARTAGIDLDQLADLSSNDPREMLSMLQAVAGSLEPVGEEELQGVQTTHYRTTIDLLRYKELVPAVQRDKLGSMMDELVEQTGLRVIPVEVWVDGDSLVRKMTMTMSTTDPSSGQSFEASIRFELYDYGKPVAIELPRTASVLDVTKLR